MTLGRTATDNEWRTLATVQSTAARWCGKVVNSLEPVERFLLGSGDPRIFAPDVPGTAAAFEAHFKSRRPGDVREIRDMYARLKQFLEGLNRLSYRVVPEEVVNREADADTYGFVRKGELTVYLAVRFFDDAGAPTGQFQSSRSVITVGPRTLTATQKARLLVHEAAHAKLGVAHAGGKFGFDVESCATGYGSVRSYEQACNNAYCYDHFAFCVGR